MLAKSRLLHALLGMLRTAMQTLAKSSVSPTPHPHLGAESSGPCTGSRWAVGARLPWGRNEASTRAHIPELKTELPQARDQSGAQAWGAGGQVEEIVIPRPERGPSEHACS